MRQAYAHDAVLTMGTGDDERAPGAALTVELCGRLEHDPPCPIAAHHSRAVRDGNSVRLRILFATDPAGEPGVRERIDTALRRGELAGPDGTTTRWQLQSSKPGEVLPNEIPHSRRLTQSP